MASSGQGFAALRETGLDFESTPMRLYAKGNALFWNAAEIDLSAERDDFAALDDDERAATIILAAMFLAGEEAVTHDIQPFIKAVAREGRLGDEMYLVQFCFEEARHTEAFRRWLDAVGIWEQTQDLQPQIAENTGYQAIFAEALPAALQALDDDSSPEAQVRASVTYNQVVEGTLALTGYHAWERVCRSRGIFPGMQQIVRLIGRDERRHMAWGTYTCRRHVAADPSLWAVVEQVMGDLLPHALSSVSHVLEQFDPPPFGLDQEELLLFAAGRAARRLNAIEQARGVGADQMDTDVIAIDLEEALAAEEAAG